MPHIVLLGDSILDNGSYTGGKPDVIAQVRERLPGGAKATLLAVDGATTRGVDNQLERLPRDASHLVLSVGGNDALGSQAVLSAPARTTADGLSRLADTVDAFSASYRKAVQACLDRRLPLAICTIYHGNFPDPRYQRQVAMALSAFNDVILRVGMENRLAVIDLRRICHRPEDHANPLEPSSTGGANIADANSDTMVGRTDKRQKAVLIGARS